MPDDIVENIQSLTDYVTDAAEDIKRVKDPKILTKSKFLNGLQCPKLLWTRCNAPDTIPPPSEDLQRIFNTGHEVGVLATRRYPGGILVPEADFLKNIEDTKAFLLSSTPRPVYEAGVLAGRLYARADILAPSPKGGGLWDIVEVKCSTSVKDVYLQDIAFQRHCYEKAGIKIDRCYLLHINNQYVRQGEIDVNGFFSLVDVTEEIVPFLRLTPEWVAGFLSIIDEPSCPKIGIREYCKKPYECQMKPSCWAFLPPFNVTELTRARGKQFDLLDQGILRIKDVSDGYKLSDNQLIQVRATIAGKTYIDDVMIKDFLKTLKYPLWHMDFETIFEAIPRFDGTRPYQQIPFQFSVHLEKNSGEVEHFEFLHKAPSDPRLPFLKALKACIGPKGTVLAWNKSFEELRIKELGDAFPEYASWCSDLLLRIEDLIVPFRKFHYYHPDQHGSASLKKVLPALVGKGYEGMVIADGGQATSEYARVTYGEGICPADRDKVYAGLEVYCGMDTKAMVNILGELRSLLKG